MLMNLEKQFPTITYIEDFGLPALTYSDYTDTGRIHVRDTPTKIFTDIHIPPYQSTEPYLAGQNINAHGITGVMVCPDQRRDRRD